MVETGCCCLGDVLLHRFIAVYMKSEVSGDVSWLDYRGTHLDQTVDLAELGTVAIEESCITFLITRHKVDLDAADVKSYRPITNLSVLSELLERLVAQQLTEYLTENGLLPELQSACYNRHTVPTIRPRLLCSRSFSHQAALELCTDTICSAEDPIQQFTDKCKKHNSLKQCLTATRPTSHN